MKVNEVRFNNWVNFKWAGVHYGDVMIDANYFSHYDKKDYIYSPIPLTEQWLIDFGCIKDGNTWDIPDDNKYLTLEMDEVTNAWEYIKDEHYLNTTYYVHQLQNLHFALTGKELIKK